MTEGITLLKWDHLNWWPDEWLKLLKKTKENTIKSRKKTKIKTEVFKVGQKVRESIYIRILDDRIFVRIQPLNKYSKGVKRKCGYQRTDFIFKVKLM